MTFLAGFILGVVFGVGGLLLWAVLAMTKIADRQDA